jgi:hypothetical protein
VLEAERGEHREAVRHLPKQEEEDEQVHSAVTKVLSIL